ncbi:MAG: hypothetical protein IAG13_35700, partial [Deltaproteobacteria bacterium]|nr:hypothetical protein [Nannocystaceae bacterium]
LPPVPQRAEPEPTRSDDDLEMLDEDDLELVEDLGGDDEDAADDPSDGEAVAAGGNGASEHDDDGSQGGESEGHAGERVSPLGVSDSSPEWKRALEDAQSDER